MAQDSADAVPSEQAVEKAPMNFRKRGLSVAKEAAQMPIPTSTVVHWRLWISFKQLESFQMGSLFEDSLTRATSVVA